MSEKPFNVIGLGEVLWDLLPSGKQLGGAPANFAFHAHQLGANAAVISRVGRDDLGRNVLDRFHAMGIDAGAMQEDDRHPTGVARVELNAQGVPHFIIEPDAAWDFITATKAALQVIASADAICFGTLAQRNAESAATIQQLIQIAPVDSLKLFDINLRQHFYNQALIERCLNLANALKLNDDELAVLAPLFSLTGPPPDQLAKLATQFNLQVIALTRGSNGSLVYQGGQWSEISGEPVTIADTVGAGDAFSAGFAIGWLKGWDVDRWHYLASDLARFVCTQAGATPEIPEPILKKFI